MTTSWAKIDSCFFILVKVTSLLSLLLRFLLYVDTGALWQDMQVTINICLLLLADEELELSFQERLESCRFRRMAKNRLFLFVLFDFAQKQLFFVFVSFFLLKTVGGRRLP